MTVLNSLLTSIVYLPLILISLVIIFLIAYGVWVYKQTGSLPPAFNKTGEIIKLVVLKLLIPLKLLGQLLWWFIPIFPDKFRQPMGYIRLGAWAPQNIARTLLLLFLSIFITVSALIYKYGYPNAIIDYSKYLNISLMGIGILFLVLLFFSFNKSVMSGQGPQGAWPSDGDLKDKNKWLFKSAGSVLFLSIAVGMMIAILGFLCYLASKYSLFSITGNNILLGAAGVGVLFLLYSMLSTNPSIKNILTNNSFLKFLFYAVFIIPCLFLDTAKYLYNQFRHTPKSVYIVLALEIILVTLYVIVPIVQKYIYVFLPPKDNTMARIKLQIKEKKKIKKDILARKKQIMSYYPPSSSGKKLPESAWQSIITNNYNIIIIR